MDNTIPQLKEATTWTDLTDRQQRELAKRRNTVARYGKRPDRRGVQDVSLGERCFLARKLEGYSATTAAELMGISHMTLLNREYDEGDVDTIARWWGLLD